MSNLGVSNRHTINPDMISRDITNRDVSRFHTTNPGMINRDAINPDMIGLMVESTAIRRKPVSAITDGEARRRIIISVSRTVISKGLQVCRNR
jgi:hypothetical protein